MDVFAAGVDVVDGVDVFFHTLAQWIMASAISWAGMQLSKIADEMKRANDRIDPPKKIQLP